jgi:hypothetical protein
MNTDRYTKVVLTIIAGCLLWMCLMSVGGRVQAQSPSQPPNSRNSGGAAQPVIIVGTGTMDLAGNVMINFTQQAGGVRRTDPTVPVQLPYSLDKPLPVGLHYTANAPMPVQITAVTKVGDWQSIRTQVEEMPPKPKPGGGGR